MMTQNKQFKGEIRARMDATGESYAAARTRILAARAAQESAPGPADIVDGVLAVDDEVHVWRAVPWLRPSQSEMIGEDE